MIQDVFPGRLIVLTSENISGNFRVEETEHRGATDGKEWGIKIKAKKF